MVLPNARIFLFVYTLTWGILQFRAFTSAVFRKSMKSFALSQGKLSASFTTLTKAVAAGLSVCRLILIFLGIALTRLRYFLFLCARVITSVVFFTTFTGTKRSAAFSCFLPLWTGALGRVRGKAIYARYGFNAVLRERRAFL